MVRHPLPAAQAEDRAPQGAGAHGRQGRHGQRRHLLPQRAPELAPAERHRHLRRPARALARLGAAAALPGRAQAERRDGRPLPPAHVLLDRGQQGQPRRVGRRHHLRRPAHPDARVRRADAERPGHHRRRPSRLADDDPRLHVAPRGQRRDEQHRAHPPGGRPRRLLLGQRRTWSRTGMAEHRGHRARTRARRRQRCRGLAGLRDVHREAHGPGRGGGRHVRHPGLPAARIARPALPVRRAGGASRLQAAVAGRHHQLLAARHVRPGRLACGVDPLGRHRGHPADPRLHGVRRWLRVRARRLASVARRPRQLLLAAVLVGTA